MEGYVSWYNIKYDLGCLNDNLDKYYYFSSKNFSESVSSKKELIKSGSLLKYEIKSELNNILILDIL